MAALCFLRGCHPPAAIRLLARVALASLLLLSSTARAQDGGEPDAATVLDAGAELLTDAGAELLTDAGTPPPDGGPPAEPVSAEELWGARVGEITIDVPPGLDRNTAEQLFGIRLGDRLNPTAIRRGVKRLVLLAKVDDVRVYAVPLPEGPDSVRLVVQMVPANLVREVRFIGGGDVPIDALRRDLPLHEGDTAEAALLEPARRRAYEALSQEGYPHARVEAAFEPLGEPASVALVFRIALGTPQKTSEIRFTGDLRYPDWQLRELVDIGRGGLASRTRLERAARELLGWYREKGHYGAVVAPQRIPLGKKGAWVPMTLHVAAGPRWVPSFRGNKVFTSGALELRLGLPPDRRLDEDLAALLEERVATTYRDAGYYHVKVKARAAPGVEKGTRRLLFLISEGPFTELGQVKLNGATGLPERQLVDEAVGAAEEALAKDSTIAQRVDRADVESVLGSGDSEAEHFPQGRDPRASGVPEWPRTWSGSLSDPEKTYDEKRFTLGARAIEDLYKSRGYLQPRVQGPIASYTMDGALVDVHYNVTAGVQTRIRTLSFRGNTAIESRELLELTRSIGTASKVEPGAPMDLFAVEEARLAVVRYYQNRGHPFANVSDDVRYEASRKDAHLVLNVEEGERVTVKQIVVRGNATTREVVILQNLAIDTGKLLRRSDIDESRRKLLNTGLFSSVSIELAPDEKGPMRTIVVDTRERKFRDVEVGAGVSSEQGPLAFLNFGHRNVGGLGIVGGARLRANWPYPMYYLITDSELQTFVVNRFNRDIGTPVRDAVTKTPLAPVAPALGQAAAALAFAEGEGVLSLGVPRLLFIPFNTGLRGEAAVARTNRLAFTLTKAGFVLIGDAKAPPFKYLRASTSPSLGLQFTGLQCHSQGEAAGADAPAGATTCKGDYENFSRKLDNGILGLVTLRLPVTFDGRDNIFKPHAGYLANGTFDVVMGGGTLFEGVGNAARTPVRSTFVRLAGGVTGYLPLTRAWTLAIGGRAGTIIPLGPTVLPLGSTYDVPGIGPVSSLPHHVPLFERFYLGGSDSVRGFAPDSVLVSDDDASSGGATRATVSTGGNGFWNVRTELRFPLAGPIEGALFLDAGQLVGDWTQIYLPAFSMGTGAGLRVSTPVGPIVLDVGFGFKDGVRPLTQSDLPRRIVLHPALGYF